MKEKLIQHDRMCKESGIMAASGATLRSRFSKK